MAITKEKKQELVAQYADMLQRSQGIVITGYRGMNMNQLIELRTKLSESNSQFTITKNTLLKLALHQSEMAVPEELLMGPVAIGFAYDDLAGTVKTLLDAAEDENLPLAIKGGIIGESVFNLEQLEQLIKLPSIAELRSQLAGLLASPATNIVSLLEEPARGVVGAINAASTQVLNVLSAYAAKAETNEAAV